MKISIITTTFNSSRTLRDTFDSVLRQSYKDIEYIVVDGGSSDGTVDIIKEYEPRFEGRMRWVSEADRGSSFYCRWKSYSTFIISYKVAADFENLLRILFVNKANAVYLPFTFVTMRDGGVSSSGISSHLQINKDHHRTLRENGVYSNYLLLSLRYIY